MCSVLSIRGSFAALLLGLCLLPAVLRGQILMDEVPASAQGIEVEDRVGEFIPLNLLFTDERGNKIGLAKFFKQGKPIVLTLNYSDCPGLCMAQLNNIVATLRELDGAGLGEQFEMISISIDPTESHAKAAQTKQKYVGLVRSPGAEKGWHFLTGDQKSIQTLAQSLGFHYFYDKASKRYSHAAVTYFLSSEGRICRYFLSLGEEPAQFKLALSEASQGKLTSSVSDALVQMCYSFDPDANRYTADARRLLSFSAGAFVLLILGFTAPFWFSGRSAAKQPAPTVAPGNSKTNAYTEPVSSDLTTDPHHPARHDQ
jgi:protein SCO1/2